jgi:hypothetical protein
MTNFPSSSRRWLCLLAGLVAAATFATSTAPALASSDPVKERENVRKQQKAINGEISNLKKTDAALQKQLAELDSKVKSSQAAYNAATAAAVSAARAAELARGNEASTTANYQRLQKATKNLALQLYMEGFAADQPRMSAQQIAKAAAHGYMGMAAVTRGQDITQRLGKLRDEMVKQREAAEQQEAALAAERARQQAALGALQSSKKQQQNVQTQIERRLESVLAEAAALAAHDKALSAEIARRAKGGGGGSGRLNTGNVDTVVVQGIRVARSIGNNLNSLLNAARADGVELSGWGYRDSSQQVALRKAHCGSSDYDIYEKPANQCHPPTARPGASMHERGLAIDFTVDGSIITSKSSPAFKWLAANAKRYGLYNLPSEPWHWSTNGN